MPRAPHRHEIDDRDGMGISWNLPEYHYQYREEHREHQSSNECAVLLLRLFVPLSVFLAPNSRSGICSPAQTSRQVADLSVPSGYWRPLRSLTSNSHEIDLSCEASGNHAPMAMRFHAGGEHVTPCPRSDSFNSHNAHADNAVGEYACRIL
jgi:hypothetical protein